MSQIRLKHIAIALAALTLGGKTPWAWGQELLPLDKAQALIFPGAGRFDAAFVTLTPDLKRGIEKASDSKMRGKEVEVWKAVGPKDAFLGFFIVDEVLGKHEYFKYAVGLSPRGQVLRLELLTYSETHGGQVQRREWLKQFEGKHFGDRVELLHGIDAISGATLSCKHVTEGMRRLLALYELALKGQP